MLDVFPNTTDDLCGIQNQNFMTSPPPLSTRSWLLQTLTLCIFAADGSLVGAEDCLFLDVTVPGRVRAGAKKPVMVYIHGGGYYAGTAIGYIGGPLATAGDVIVVAMNYRLGIFGFLSDGPGKSDTENMLFML